MPFRIRTRTLAQSALLGVMAAGCNRAELPERQFYDTQIQPVFNSFCVGNTSPCHKIDPQTGVALGNLDLTSFEAVHRRPDVLRTYGVYPEPLLLIKAVPESTIQIPYRGKIYGSEIRHAGGNTLIANSPAFFELKRWLASGATRTGLPEAAGERKGQGGCHKELPPGEALPDFDRGSPTYRRFLEQVQPIVVGSCALGTCHGSPQSDFYVTCGETDEQRAFNYLRVASFVAPAPDNVEQSELLRRPLAPRAGGVSHTGGVFFADKSDALWKRLRDFATEVQKNNPVTLERSRGEAFFTDHVMPVLIRRGCALEGCHSPNGFNDFRLRPGALGFLSPFAIRRNYDTALHEFMSLDTTDVRQSRLVRKNILASDGGIVHRGGPLLQSPGEDINAPCPQPFDPATASAFCTLAEWHRIEREDHAALVSPLAEGDVVPLAFVSRPPNPDGPTEFDTHRGGADLLLADAVIGPDGGIAEVSNARSALAGCAGLAGADLDVRGPEWSHDGQRLVFAARTGAATGLDLWMLDLTAGACTRLTNDNGRIQGPVRVHNFDPVFAPNGALVFASTRAGTLTLKRLLPNSDLFRVGPELDFAKIEPITVLSNAELAPAFMGNGQLSFTAEKATPEFYQLSGRRINWDLTDYHPLLAQRAQSDDTFGKMMPSIGYQQATEIREDLDRNFLLVLSDSDARGGGGALGVFNRSVGPFETGRTEITYSRSLVLADRAAHARAGTAGVYRSPYPTGNGEILASYAGNVSNPAVDVPRYDLVLLNQHTGARRVLVPGGASSLVEAALGYKRASRRLFANHPQLVFGGRANGKPEEAVMHLPDLPVLATLLNANLRRKRNVEAFDKTAALRVYEVMPPPSTSPDANLMLGSQKVYTQRKDLGKATLESDKSLKVKLPIGKPLILELVDGEGKPVFTMQEEHQMGPGEIITPGVPRALFNGVCGGCHGSLSGLEADVVVSPDALTGASVSLSRDASPKSLD